MVRVMIPLEFQLPTQTREAYTEKPVIDQTCHACVLLSASSDAMMLLFVAVLLRRV